MPPLPLQLLSDPAGVHTCGASAQKKNDEVQNDENPVGPLASQTRAVGAIFGSDGGQADDNEKAASIRP